MRYLLLLFPMIIELLAWDTVCLLRSRVSSVSECLLSRTMTFGPGMSLIENERNDHDDDVH